MFSVQYARWQTVASERELLMKPGNEGKGEMEGGEGDRGGRPKVVCVKADV